MDRVIPSVRSMSQWNQIEIKFLAIVLLHLAQSNLNLPRLYFGNVLDKFLGKYHSKSHYRPIIHFSIDPYCYVAGVTCISTGTGWIFIFFISPVIPVTVWCFGHHCIESHECVKVTYNTGYVWSSHSIQSNIKRVMKMLRSKPLASLLTFSGRV